MERKESKKRTQKIDASPDQEPQPLPPSRRQFLKQAAATGVGIAALSLLPPDSATAEPKKHKLAGPGDPRRKAKPEERKGTLLDEVGRLAGTLPDEQVAAWKNELKKTRLAPRRAALLHLWIGEWELAGHEEPKKADWHFRRAQQLTNT